MKELAFLVPEVPEKEQAVSWGFLRRVIVHLAYIAQDAPGDHLETHGECPWCTYALAVVREAEQAERKGPA